MEELTQFISTVGFPIAVAAWMLIKTSKDSENLRTAVSELTTVVRSLTDKMGGGQS